MMIAFNHFFFSVFPYVAIFTFLIVTIYRYRNVSFTYSSLSSQFLEGKTLFWGTVPFHWGLIVVFLGHVGAFLFPKEQLMWNSQPVRLIILEVTAFTFGLSVLIGLGALFVRRLVNARVRVVTTPMDIVIECLILIQIILGCWIALGYRWGSSWFAADLSPYLWSLVKFDPQIQAMSAMPWVIKVHVINAFTLILLFPFTRLVHVLVAPFHYIWRPYQQVMWYWDRRIIRQPQTPWNKIPPKNN